MSIAPASEQLELTLDTLTAPVYAPGATIQQRFEAFHAANPWVYDALVRLTHDWVRRGNPRIGIGMLTEIIRWQYGRRTAGDAFKINNNFRSRYVRLMIAEHPEWASVFSTRELQAP